LDRPAFGAVYVYRNVKGRFWRDLRLVLFVYIVMLKEVYGETCVRCFCVHRIFKGSFWRDLRYDLFQYIILLNVNFGETCFMCCLSSSYCFR
jgi:hypothetical protein